MELKKSNPSSDKDRLVIEDDELLIFEEEDERESNVFTEDKLAWKILIVDDEPSVHQATQLALKNVEFEGKKLLFLSAHSAQTAKEILTNNLDIAMVLLDVVMENDRAGLDLVKYIREELNNKIIRIILRTGQPGEAPEESAIIDYDINDYKLKTELTRQKLLIAAIGALRSYRDLMTIEQNRQELTNLYLAVKIARDNLEELVEMRTQKLAEEIEERKKFEKTLRLSQFALDRAKDSVYFLDRDSNFFYVNDSACETLGYSKEELLNMTIYEIDRNLLPDSIFEYWQQLQQQKSLTRKSILQTKTGQYLPVEITDNYLQFDGREYSCGIIRDISEQQAYLRERKQVEQQLKAANQKLEYLASIDGLTQISNRRSFDVHLQQEWSRMSREKFYLSLILIDVDFFKQYNDYYGHQTGDDCLKQVAIALNNTIKRTGDLVARYGGEEFAVILPNTNTRGALYLAEQVKLSVARLSLPHANSVVSSFLTISLGIASLIPSQDLSQEIIIELADRALYQAKQQGRDRIIVSG